MKVSEQELGKPEDAHYNLTPANTAPSDSCWAGDTDKVPGDDQRQYRQSEEHEGITVHHSERT